MLAKRHNKFLSLVLLKLQLEDRTPRILLLVLLALAVIMSPFGLINSSYNLATMTNIFLPLPYISRNLTVETEKLATTYLGNTERQNIQVGESFVLKKCVLGYEVLITVTGCNSKGFLALPYNSGVFEKGEKNFFSYKSIENYIKLSPEQYFALYSDEFRVLTMPYLTRWHFSELSLPFINFIENYPQDKTERNRRIYIQADTN